jgi:peptidoglycan/LPS O-acetylase OafA/YrhL
MSSSVTTIGLGKMRSPRPYTIAACVVLFAYAAQVVVAHAFVYDAQLALVWVSAAATSLLYGLSAYCLAISYRAREKTSRVFLRAIAVVVFLLVIAATVDDLMGSL